MSEIKIKKRRHRKQLNKIAFDTEIVTKEVAKQTLHENESIMDKNEHKQKLNHGNTPPKIKKRKGDKGKLATKVTSNELEVAALDETCNPDIKNSATKAGKKRKNTELHAVENNQDAESNTLEKSVNVDAPNPSQKTESKRAKKRKKHEELLSSKKLKLDSETRDKCLNYLSKWKHSRNEWKFEKLRQVWLQQNMFDFEKVPDKCWETVIEYFENSKGNIRHKIIETALKLIEENDQNQEVTEEDSLRTVNSNLKRAKDVIQYLQT